MREIILKGHKAAKGKAEGEALVSDKPFCFLFQVDTKTGIVIQRNSDWEGINLSGKILVYPMGKGSTATSYVIYEMARCGTKPAGIVNIIADPVTVAGALLSGIPMVHSLDGNPVGLIKTGDYVELDADNGIVRVKSE